MGEHRLSHRDAGATRDQGNATIDMSADIDHQALRERYRAERDKRLRPDGNDQYIEVTGRFADLAADPYTPVGDRPPRHEEVDAVCVGAGFGSLVTAAALREAGLERITLIDKAGDVGGVWYWNRYPGAMCDTASMVYLPLLEETGYMPSRKYTYGTENQAHAQRIAKHYGLYDGALFSTSVTAMSWDAEAARWIVHTDRGDELRARYVTLGMGPLDRPKLPGIPGLDQFEGDMFLASRWNYAITGGDPEGAPMVELADKRVGIVGTGATAVQCIPALGRDAQTLYVFQRTPSAIDERNNRPLDPEWFATLQPGWQEEWRRNFTILQTGGFTDVDLVQDGWTDIAKRIRDRVVDMVGAGAEPDDFGELLRRAYEESDDEKMNEIRARVDAIVEDPETAEALKPWYRQLCKRPCFHDEYLQTYNRPNVHLIDTDGQGVRAIDETGVWVGDRHHEVDLLVFATGFEVGTRTQRRWGFDVTGRNGRRLSEHWEAGMRTLHGNHVHGFPNLFIIGMSQGANLISNITHNLTDAATTVSRIVEHAETTGATTVEVTEEAEDAWVELVTTNTSGILGGPDCTPGYYNNEGQEIEIRDGIMAGGHPQGPVAFFDHIAAWRSSGDFEGLAFS